MDIKQLFIALLITQLSLTTACAKNIESLQGAESVIAELVDSLDSSQPKEQSKPRVLLNDIGEYRERQKNISNKQSAKQWLELAERAQNITRQEQIQSLNAIDSVTGQAVGMKSLIASLPAPTVWPELYKTNSKLNRELSLKQTSLNFILASLVNKQESKMKSLKTMQELINNSKETDQYQNKYIFAQLQQTVIRQSGDVNAIMALLEHQLVDQENAEGEIALPDLVTLLGKEKAELWLRKQLILSKHGFSVDQGDQTLLLAQQLALELADKLLIPHWGLVKGLKATQLYEAIESRFSNKGARWNRKQAELYYLLGLIATGKSEKASEVAVSMSDKFKELTLPRKALDDLEKLGYTQELYSFFSNLLAQKSTFSFWDDYIKLSALTGNTQNLINLIETKLSSTELTSKRKLWFREKLVMALLANDQTERAGKLLLKLIADSSNDSKGPLALKLVLMGELLNKKAWVKSGLATSKQVFDSQQQEEPTGHTSFYSEYIKTLRRLNKISDAEQVVVKQISQFTSIMQSYGEATGMKLDSQLSILLRPLAIELIGIYADAERWGDVIYVAEHFPYWGESDLSEIFTETDSNKIPVALTIAKALVNTGKTEPVIAILEALIKEKGGLDQAYELYTQIKGKDAIVFLDQRYQDDQFEERPLIWKATLLLQADQLQHAKTTLQQAIQIDPSDGEQGTGDRMRAYAIMAKILAAEGDSEGADFNRRAVQAIRLSEQADRFTDAGMFQRAIKMYSDASNIFEDAYCIQSRLAFQMTKQGRIEEAASHYQKAFELMPSSFGRVESHCFGCESVFKHPTAQTIAEQIFDKLIKEQPLNPQIHYMMGYLRKEQGKYLEAIPHFRKAVTLDPQYLNAWKQFYKLGEHVYIEAWERDIAALKMLELDPSRKHAKVDLADVSDLKGLWQHAEIIIDRNADKPKQLYALIASAKQLKSKGEKSASSMQEKLSVFGYGRNQTKFDTPGLFLTQSQLIGYTLQLISSD